LIFDENQDEGIADVGLEKNEFTQVELEAKSTQISHKTSIKSHVKSKSTFSS
jgi:hypothetical protein